MSQQICSKQVGGQLPEPIAREAGMPDFTVSSRSRWLAARNAVHDPRWKTARRIKLRSEPVCQVRIYCSGALATEVSPMSWTIPGGSFLNPANLQSACPACYQWKASTAMLKAHV